MASSGEQLERLMAWYAAHRNDHWEHSYGLKLDPLPEGGWLLIIDTTGTELEGYQIQGDLRARSAADWFEWRFEASGFHAKGGPRNLGDMIEAFFAEIDRVAAAEPRRG